MKLSCASRRDEYVGQILMALDRALSRLAPRLVRTSPNVPGRRLTLPQFLWLSTRSISALTLGIRAMLLIRILSRFRPFRMFL